VPVRLLPEGLEAGLTMAALGAELRIDGDDAKSG
jgi:hypothetical protein